MAEPDIYERYPMMRPYVGPDYGAAGRPRLLLVGESHYLPEGSVQHKTPERWYGSDHRTLTKTELDWVNTAQTIEWSKARRFKTKAHGIWKNSLTVINEVGPKYDDFTRVTDDVAICNFFLRPALRGQSLWVTDRDVQVANAVLIHICSIHEPTAVAFLSRLAGGRCECRDRLPADVVVTSHPSTPWWNRRAKRYGGKRGRDLLGDFVKSVW